MKLSELIDDIRGMLEGTIENKGDLTPDEMRDVGNLTQTHCDEIADDFDESEEEQ